MKAEINAEKAFELFIETKSKAIRDDLLSCSSGISRCLPDRNIDETGVIGSKPVLINSL